MKKDIVFGLILIFLILSYYIYLKEKQEKEKIHDFMNLYENVGSFSDLQHFIAHNKLLDYNALIMKYFPNWNPCIKEIDKFQLIFDKTVSPNIHVSFPPLKSAMLQDSYKVEKFQLQYIFSNRKAIVPIEEAYGFSSKTSFSNTKERERSQASLLFLRILLGSLADPNYILVSESLNSTGKSFKNKESLLFSAISHLGIKKSDQFSGDLERIKYLLLFGANPNIGNSDEISDKLVSTSTPLMLACRYGQEEVVKLLLQRNANPFLVDNCGWTCIDYLKMGGYHFKESSLGNRILKLLEEYMRNRVPSYQLSYKKKDPAYFMSNLAPYPDENLKFGYIDKRRKWVIPPIYDAVSHFENECAIVKYKGKWGVIDMKGTFLIPPVYSFPPEYFNDGLVRIMTDSNKIGFKNKNNIWVIPPEYDNAIYFSEGRSAVEKNKKWRIIDTKGNFITPPLNIDSIDVFNDGKARIYKDTKSGFINKSGDIKWD